MSDVTRILTAIDEGDANALGRGLKHGIVKADGESREKWLMPITRDLRWR